MTALRGRELIEYLETEIEVYRKLWLAAQWKVPEDVLDDEYLDMLGLVEKERASK